MVRGLKVENLLPQNVGSIINYLQYSTEVAQWVIPIVAVDHNQLRTIASETADQIDWSHPHCHGQYQYLHVLHGVNAAYKSQDLLQQPGLEHEATGMPDHSELDDSSILFYCSRNNTMTVKQNTLLCQGHTR